MKRNVMISGDFTLSEMTGSNANASAKKGNNAKARIEALKAAGVDTSNYFPMGEEMVIKVVDGVPTQVLDDDPIFQSITNGGYLNHYKLYRRWVMSQMFHILRDMEKKDKSFNALIQYRGYEYQWKVVENELYAQMKMEKNSDVQSLSGRARWFNSDSVAMMAEDYVKNLKDYIDGSLTYRIDRKGVRKFKHTCKGAPYIRLGGECIFVVDLQKKVFDPLQKAIKAIKNSKTATELYVNVFKFNRQRKSLKWDTKQSDSFINAYKGSGSYYTMRNLIMFHGARFKCAPTQENSLLLVEENAKEHIYEGWRMLGVLKQLIADSGISVEGKIREWRK